MSEQGPDHYLRTSFVLYCEAVQRLGVIVAHMPASHRKEHRAITVREITDLEDGLRAARENYLAYIGMTTETVGEA